MEAVAWSTLWASFIVYAVGSLATIGSLRGLRGVLEDSDDVELSRLVEHAREMIMIGGVMIIVAARITIAEPGPAPGLADKISLVISVLAPIYMAVSFKLSLATLTHLTAKGHVYHRWLTLSGLGLVAASGIMVAEIYYGGIVADIVRLGASIALLILFARGLLATSNPVGGE